MQKEQQKAIIVKKKCQKQIKVIFTLVLRVKLAEVPE